MLGATKGPPPSGERDPDRSPERDGKASETFRKPWVRPRPPEEVRQAALDPANRFGKYVLLQRVGRGSNGAVYRAWEAGLGRFVAVKLLKADDAEAIPRFMREAHLAGALNHPNIVQVFEVGCIGDRHFIAMEYVDGMTLDDLSVDLRRAIEIVRDCARAVHHAHERGIVHRDIKPLNIMIRRDGSVCVTDFGLARTTNRGATLSVTGCVLGSPAYMSPEQAFGNIRVDRRADVYGLGATLYALVCGASPYSGDSAIDVVYKVREEDPPSPRSLAPATPRDVELIIQKSMQRERDRRYATALELAEDLDRLLRGGRIMARPTSLWYRTRRRIARRPAISALMALLAALILGGAGAITHMTLAANRQRAGIEVGQRAGRAYANRNMELALALSEESIGLAPDYAIGHFWRGRVRLFAYTRQRTLPAAFTVDGIVEFSFPPPESPNQTLLRQQALKDFTRMYDAGKKGLEGWEDHCRRGILHLFDGAYEEAEGELTVAWKTGMADGEVAYYLARAQYFLKKFDAGIGTLDTMRMKRGIYGREMEVTRAQMMEARALSRALRGEDPTEELKSAARACRDHADDWPLARIAYEDIRLQLVRHAISIGEGERGKRDLDEIIDWLTVALEEEPAYHQVLGDAVAVRARWYATHGDGESALKEFDAALEHFARASDQDPLFDGAWVRSAQTHRELSMLLAGRGKSSASATHLESAAEDFDRVRAELPDAAIERAQIAGRMRRLRSPDEAVDAWMQEVEALDAIRSKWSGHARAILAAARVRVSLALLLHRRGEDPTPKFEAAMKLFDDAFAINPDWVDAACARGTARLNHALYVEDSGGDPESLYALAMQDFDDAAKFGSTLAFQSRGLAGMNLAAYRIRVGEDPTPIYERALDAFDDALEINSEMTAAYRGRAGVRLNQATHRAIHGEDPTELFTLAEADFARAVEIHPESVSALLGWGNLCMNRAEWRRLNREDPAEEIRWARSHYNKALEVNPYEAELLMRRGMANVKLSEHDKAYTDLKAAVAINPAYALPLGPTIRRCKAAIRAESDF